MRIKRADRLESIRGNLEAFGKQPNSSPHQLRAQVLEAVTAAVGAKEAMYFSVGRLGNGAHCAGVVQSVGFADADLLARQHRCHLHHLPMLLHELSAGRGTGMEGFLNHDQLVETLPFLTGPYYKKIWKDRNIHDALWLPVASQGMRQGWVCVLRSGTKAPFSRRICQALTPLVAPLTSLLETARQSEQQSLPDTAAHLVLQVQGQIEYGSATATAWLALDGVEKALQLVIEEVNAGHLIDVTASLGPVEAHVVSLRAANNTVRYGVKLQALQAPSRSPFAALSDRGVAVASLAAQGMSATAIAKRRGVSGHTVKAQLKAIYKRLGINSRAELTTLFARAGLAREGVAQDGLARNAVAQHARQNNTAIRSAA